jgi:subtilisin-like proprotein convertase family protein
MIPVALDIPDYSYADVGPASRYPAKIHVFGQTTNLADVAVTLRGLSHTESEDIIALLVGPSGKSVMLMSGVGAANGVANATIAFQRGGLQPPQTAAIPSDASSYYSPCNYWQVTAMPQVGADPPPSPPAGGQYSVHLEDFSGDEANGTWKLYVYNGGLGVGELEGSWKLNFTFP